MKEIIAKALLNKIERLEAFEERLQVRFEHLSVRAYDNGGFIIFCELHSNSGTTIKESIIVECVLYESNGSIFEMVECHISANDFYVFETIKIMLLEDGICDRVGKIRIYPKKL